MVLKFGVCTVFYPIKEGGSSNIHIKPSVGRFFKISLAIIRSAHSSIFGTLLSQILAFSGVSARISSAALSYAYGFLTGLLKSDVLDITRPRRPI